MAISGAMELSGDIVDSSATLGGLVLVFLGRQHQQFAKQAARTTRWSRPGHRRDPQGLEGRSVTGDPGKESAAMLKLTPARHRGSARKGYPDVGPAVLS
jgi:hypothetical protein